MLGELWVSLQLPRTRIRLSLELALEFAPPIHSREGCGPAENQFIPHRISHNKSNRERTTHKQSSTFKPDLHPIHFGMAMTQPYSSLEVIKNQPAHSTLEAIPNPPPPPPPQPEQKCFEGAELENTAKPRLRLWKRPWSWALGLLLICVVGAVVGGVVGSTRRKHRGAQVENLYVCSYFFFFFSDVSDIRKCFFRYCLAWRRHIRAVWRERAIC